MVDAERELAICFSSMVDAERAEIPACRWAVQLAREEGVLELVLQTDS
jgi:hypothetical protein